MRVYLGDSGKLQVYVNKQKYALDLYTIISIKEKHSLKKRNVDEQKHENKNHCIPITWTQAGYISWHNFECFSVYKNMYFCSNIS